MDPKHLIVVIDGSGNEALYFGGELVETRSNTIFACDIAKAAKDSIVQFSHVEVDFEGPWPKRVESVLMTARQPQKV